VNRDLAIAQRLKEALEQADLTKTRMREFLAVVLAARDVKANPNDDALASLL
jgi:hypothetical protein